MKVHPHTSVRVPRGLVNIALSYTSPFALGGSYFHTVSKRTCFAEDTYDAVERFPCCERLPSCRVAVHLTIGRVTVYKGAASLSL